MRHSTLNLLFAALGLLLALLASTARAGVYITAPTAASRERGGTELLVQWRDDHKPPRLRNWGNLTVWLATGSATNQFMLQRLATDVRPSAHGARARVDAGVGETSSEYFIRIVGSATLSDGTHPQSFSARFRLSRMTGKFNTTVAAAISSSGNNGAGAGAAAGGASASTRTSSGSAHASTSTHSSSTVNRPVVAATTSTTPTGAATLRAEMPLRAGPVVVALGCVLFSVLAGLALV